MRWCEVVEFEVVEFEVVEIEVVEFEVAEFEVVEFEVVELTSLTLAYVIIICNDVTRASLNKDGQNLLTKHFFSVPPRV
jgi:hypothetical protein